MSAARPAPPAAPAPAAPVGQGVSAGPPVRSRRVLSGALVVANVVAADQAMKAWVETFMGWHETIPLLPFLALFRTWNEGIAFSMLGGVPPAALLALTLGVTGFMLWLWRGLAPGHPLAHVGFGLVVGGAIGNFIDRATLGHVVDYVLVHTPGWSFAVFNLADAAISVGAALVLADEVLGWRRRRDAPPGD